MGATGDHVKQRFGEARHGHRGPGPDTGRHGRSRLRLPPLRCLLSVTCGPARLRRANRGRGAPIPLQVAAGADRCRRKFAFRHGAV